MATDLTPASTVVTAGTVSYRGFLSAFETHIGGSSLWSVKQSTDNGSGNDYGITLTPDDTGESFDTNIRFNSTDGNVYVAIDPQGSITDALDPVGTGSTETSPEGWRALFSEDDGDFNADLILVEWNDAWGWMIKDTLDNHVEWWLQVGRIVEPTFANDPGRNRDGLAWFGGEPRNFNTNIGRDDNYNNNPACEAHNPDGWTQVYAHNTPSNGHQPYSTNELPVPFVVFDDGVNDDRVLGHTKYAHQFHRPGGENGLERLEIPSTGDGFLYVDHNFGGGKNLIVPWDPNVVPT